LTFPESCAPTDDLSVVLCTPGVIQRRFLETPGTIIITHDTVTVRLDRRAYSPVLRAAGLPNDTVIPWWHNQTLHYEFN
jgi:hypothetical protein